MVDKLFIQSSLSKNLDSYSSLYRKVIISGDFNEDIGRNLVKFFYDHHNLNTYTNNVPIIGKPVN